MSGTADTSNAITESCPLRMPTLRAYQREAVDAVYHHLRERDDNPCVVIPTAGGKTLVIGTICRDAVRIWNGRVLILAHVKELLEQAAEKLQRMAPDLPVGIYSAGLRRRDLGYAVTIAGIQSLYEKAADVGPMDLVIVDEAHLIAPEGEGMYRTFLAAMRQINPQVRVIGLTATPFRMKTGTICSSDNILNHICYEVSVRELIVQGYLCPLRTKAGSQRPDYDQLHVRGGEYVANEVEALMDDDALVGSACREIVEYTKDRKSVLIFASGVQHGEHIVRVLKGLHRTECGFVCGETLPFDRAETLARFRDGKLKYLCNVNVLTTGFDAPNIDCVALVRPTLSPGLFYQMCLDMQTEVLTRPGWRRCHEVVIGDQVAAFDMETGCIEYTPAQDKVHRSLRPGESIYGLVAPHMDLRITDQHNMVVRGKSRTCRKWQLQSAVEASRRLETFLIPVSGSGANHEQDANLTDAEVLFLGWFLTDGYHNRSNGTICISQSVDKYADAVRSLLTECGFGFREYRIKRSGSLSAYADNLHFLIPYGEPRCENAGKRGWRSLEKWIDKDVPSVYDSLSARQFGILIEAMNNANGHQPRHLSYIKRTRAIAVGCRQRMADRIQQLAIERGFRCNVSSWIARATTWNRSPQRQWMVRIKRQQVAYVGGRTHRENALCANRCSLNPVEYQPNEWVWCLTTEKGTLVTRRNGKVAILGNCGRGFRLHPGKENCLVLDFGGNALRHGPVDQLRVNDPGAKGNGEAPAKECPKCHEIIAAGYATCPACGHEFPPPEKQKHTGTASDEGILSDQVMRVERQVEGETYSVHVKRDAPLDAPRTMRVDYRLGWQHYISEWVCFEHTGYARQKAEAWWRRRSDDAVPIDADEAVELARAGALAKTLSITIEHKPGDKYARIIGHQLGPKPPRLESDECPTEFVPFNQDAEGPFADENVPF
jgi:superfamily II DNA or RNA helicase